MLKKSFILGLIASGCFLSLSDTSEAGHRHRRGGRHASAQNCAPVQSDNCGCNDVGYSSSGYGHSSMTSYGSSNYGSYYPSSGYSMGNSYGTNYGSNVGANVSGNSQLSSGMLQTNQSVMGNATVTGR
jgi:hypothetical protein